MFTHVLFLTRIARSQLFIKHVKDVRVIPHVISLSRMALWLATGVALAPTKTTQGYGNPIRTSSHSTGDSLAESPMSHDARRRLIRSLPIREQALVVQKAGASSWGFTHTSYHLLYARADLPNPI